MSNLRYWLSQEEGFEDIESRKAVSKQTIEIGKKAYGHIRGMCILKGISFQDFAIRALNRELNAAGEPTVEELEATE